MQRANSILQEALTQSVGLVLTSPDRTRLIRLLENARTAERKHGSNAFAPLRVSACKQDSITVYILKRETLADAP